MQILYYAVFPGFVFAAIAGLLTSWFDRKVTARVQYRVGPPWYQNFADVMKLTGKEVILPENARKTGFLIAPLIALAASILVATMIGRSNVNYANGYVGDIIVFWYFLTVPSLMIILGAGASGNPLAAVGLAREMKLILSYELPFLIVIAMVVFKAGTLSLGGILQYQFAHGPILYSLSGVIGFIVALLCVQAKLGLVPFDMAEAETELAGGTLYDYSGAALGAFKLSKAILLYTLPIFLITLFWGGIRIDGGIGILWAVLKYVLIIFLITLIRNTNPRLRIDQAMRFFWGWMTLLAVVAFVLSTMGL